jgi:acyl-CoA dehydrogenase
MISWLLAMLTAVFSIVYLNFSLKKSAIALSTVSVLLLVTGFAGIVLSLSSIVIIGMLYYLFSNEAIRQQRFVKPLLKAIQNGMPKISDTERVALEAGTVGWDGELFSGNPNWKKLLERPAPKLTNEEQAFLDGPVEKLCSMINDWQINHIDYDLPPEMWDFIKKEGFFGLMIPKEYGGLGFSDLAHSDILAKIAGCSSVVASTVSVPNSLGPAELIRKYGTTEQKNHYLPKLASGEEVPCFGLTGPNAGSDATSLPDLGIVCYGNFAGKKTLGINLNFEKRYITLAPIATVLGIAFQMHDPEHLLGDIEDIGITCALIPANTPGITKGNRHMPLNCMFQNGPIFGKDVFIPIDWLIGGRQMAGQGWKMLVECLSCGRAISLPSAASGKARAAASATGAYARIRKQFNNYIGKFEGVQEALATMAANVYLSEAARRFTATMIDQGEKPAVPGAIVKCHLTERSRQSATLAMDVHGGKGIILGPKNYTAESYINAPVGITVEGANILTRNLIIFGQGSIRCHPFIMQELLVLELNDEKQKIVEFDKILKQHLKYTIHNSVKTLFNAITGGKFINAPVKSKEAKLYKKVTMASSAFAVLADFSLLILGGRLKFKERLSARLGDLLSMLYLASMSLKRYHDEGKIAEDYDLLEYNINQTMNEFWVKANEIINNFPNLMVKILLKIIIMPFGIPVNKSHDNQARRIAEILLTPSKTRERLLYGTYLAPSEHNPLGKLELALKDIIASEEIDKQINQAYKNNLINAHDLINQIEQAVIAKIISPEQAAIAKQAHKMRQEIIAVDHFAYNELKNLHK